MALLQEKQKENDSGSDDGGYENFENENEKEIFIEEDSETESKPEAVENLHEKKSMVDPLFKWPKRIK